MVKRIYIDVREPAEFKQGHVKHAINIPLGDIFANSSRFSALDKNIEYVFYCRSGSRANTAMRIFKAEGFKKLSNGINQQAIGV